MFLSYRKNLQIIESLTCFFILFLPVFTSAQSTFIPLGDKQYSILDRLEIKTKNPEFLFSGVKPYSRITAVRLVKYTDSMLQIDKGYAKLSPVDHYDMDHLLMDNSEWSGTQESFLSKKPVFGKNGIYKSKDNLFEVNNGDFFLAINPVLYFIGGKEKGNQRYLYQNTRGLTLRGRIGSQIGFNLYLTDNQERDPAYVMQYINQNRAVPGEGFYKHVVNTNTDGFDYFDSRGYVTWNAGKHITMQFGFDKNVIGDGYRSLFLSDFSNNATFLKVNGRFGKINYENILMELYQPFILRSGDVELPRKYARMSYLSVNAARWLNIGLFEGTIFGGSNHFDGSYLIPVMFVTPTSGSNAIVGLSAKANVAGKFQFYGQLISDESEVGQLFNSNGSWQSRTGFQLGGKYVDAFGVKNMDIQLEMNQVRPYTYAYSDSVANYTHYNQPLAHPLGANFRELVGILKIQPLPKLYLEAQVIHYFKGLDSSGLNFGGNPFENYNNRVMDLGNSIGSGNRATANIFSGIISYEVRENMFFDLSGLYRTYLIARTNQQTNTTAISLSFRWNISRREFNF